MADTLPLRLPPDCTIRVIRALKADMAAALAGAKAVALDCASVERADISFVQLVLAAAGTATRQGKRLDLVHATDAVEAAFRRAGTSAPRASPHGEGACAAARPACAA